MQNQIICKKEVEFYGEKYLVYLKRIATKISPGGEVKSTAIRAFVRKIGIRN